MPTTTDTTRTVNSRDVERNNVTTAVIPYIPYVDEEDKDSDKVEVKLPNGNKIYLPFITVSANIESFATRSIIAKLNLMKDLDYQNQAEKLERVIKNINNIINDLKKIINRKNILVIHTNSENNIYNKELNFIEERVYGVSKIYFAKLNLT